MVCFEFFVVNSVSYDTAEFGSETAFKVLLFLTEA